MSRSGPSNTVSWTGIESYLAALHLTDTEAARIRRAIPAGADSASAFDALHHALADPAAPATDAPQERSLPARLRTLLGSALTDHTARDAHDQLRLLTTPPIQRAHMLPQPWGSGGVWRALGQLLPGRTSRVTTHATGASGRHPWQVSARNRRWLLVMLTLLQTITACYFMTAVLPYHGTRALEMVLLVLYAILFTWVGLGFWTALMGFFLLVTGRDKHAISASAEASALIGDDVRTAILIPICNEDVTRVFAGIRATYDSLRRAGLREPFDFYILSDSNRADTRVAEVDAWITLCKAVDGFGHIHYRHRRLRLKRKSGNIADWCRRWGNLYRYMVILDADSVMSGDCLKRLVQLMEANPGAGIIQTAPRAAGRETLYARIQQFASRVYGPLFTAGLHFWQLGESHYWGHNAIIRVAPFMEHCALSRLPGYGALSGEILSHDFVEAALMRRAGWSVWIAHDLPGSYEEMPPTLLDELQRDQRWCQGNLQNFRLFFTKGLHPAHRAVFMTGVMAYLSAPLWFCFLALSTAMLAMHSLAEPEYFSEPYQLFPTWPEWHPEWAIGLFAATATLLFLPKLLAMLRVLLQRDERRLYGGGWRLIASTLMETLFSALLAPVRMLFHTRYVLGALLGFSVQWKSPPREDTATPWSEALKRHLAGTMLGLFWLLGVYHLNPVYITWLLPVAGALILSIPLSVWSSRSGPGRWSRARRWFLIPEESVPPRELRWLRAAQKRAGRHPLPRLADGVRSPRLQAVLSAMARRGKSGDGIDTPALESLDEAERNRLLDNRQALHEQHRRLWTE